MTETEVRMAINRLMCGNTAHSKDASYIKLAIEALEKQIPKKPIIKKWSGGNKTYNCPSCDCDYNRFYISKEYCMYCGQKIDWEEVEE